MFSDNACAIHVLLQQHILFLSVQAKSIVFVNIYSSALALEIAQQQ